MEFDKLLLEKDYNLSTLKVLLALKARLDYNNRIKTFTQIEIAKEAKTSQSRVSPALTLLLEDHIIRKEGRDYYFVDNYIKGAGNPIKQKAKQKNIKI
jgi:DNA-binding MarR family transcriptional regulator